MRNTPDSFRRSRSAVAVALSLVIWLVCPTAWAKKHKSAVSSEKASVSLAVGPALQTGKETSVTLRRADGQPVRSGEITMNGTAISTNEQGVAKFVVPNDGAVTLAVPGTDIKKTFALLPGGFLVEDSDAAPFVERAINMARQSKFGPRITYSPVVLEPDSDLVLLGKNFSERSEVYVDGSACEILSVSPVAILAHAPARLTVGPIKELFVAEKGGESSNVVEVDVCQPSLNLASKEGGGSDAVTGRAVAVGTNMPCLIEIHCSSDDVNIMLGKTATGKNATFITSGGESNYVPVTFCGSATAGVDCAVHLMSDFEDTDNAALRALHTEAVRAQLIRLKRRLIGIEARLAEARDARERLGLGADMQERTERLTTELKALSVRQSAVTNMLASRQALFQAAGASPSDYELAMDEASSGTYYLFEKAVRQAVLVPKREGAIISDTPPVVALAPSQNQRFRLLKEPRINLLPPIDLQLAIIKDPVFKAEPPKATPPAAKPEVKKPAVAKQPAPSPKKVSSSRATRSRRMQSRRRQVTRVRHSAVSSKKRTRSRRRR